MKKLFIAVFVLIVLAALGVLAGLVWWRSVTSAPSAEPQEKTILITKGSSAEAIATKLHEAGVIKNPFAFKLYVQFHNLSASIPTGEFVIPADKPLSDVINLLRIGPVELWVTVPEGFRREEIAVKFAGELGLAGEAKNAFQAAFLQESVGLEGYLFPDTYLVPRDVTPQAVVALLRSTFDKRFTSEMRSRLSERGLNLSEAVVHASLIERETKSEDPEERPIVAGIINNRLAIGMPLQIDATVQYAIANEKCSTAGGRNIESCVWWPQSLTRDDFDIDSPYNTYKYPGLPPAPISNPGLSALEAVARPKSTNYLYYIHEPNGTVHYAQTLDEHNRNIEKYLSN